MMLQVLLTALDEWITDQSAKQVELLTAFMEPVLAAVAAFTMLESTHIQELPSAVCTRDKITNKLAKFIAAKSIRAQLAAISTMLQDAMVLLERAVGVANLVQGGEAKQILEDSKQIAEQTKEAVRYR
jgi:hypothetical protein